MHTLGYNTDTTRQLVYRDTQYSRMPGQTPWENLSPLVIHDRASFLAVDDDFAFDTTASYTVVKGTGGSLALASSLGGWVSIPTAASAANDYQLISTPNAIFSLKAGTPIVYEFGVNVTEANTNKASWAVGLSSATATGFLQNTGATASSYSGVVFWKAQNALALKCQTSNGSTQKSSGTLATVVSGQTYLLGAYIDPNDGVTAKVHYYVSTVSGSPLVRTFVTSGTLDLAVGSLAAMKLIMAVRTASTGAETLTVDFARCVQVRPLV